MITGWFSAKVVPPPVEEEVLTSSSRYEGTYSGVVRVDSRGEYFVLSNTEMETVEGKKLSAKYRIHVEWWRPKV